MNLGLWILDTLEWKEAEHHFFGLVVPSYDMRVRDIASKNLGKLKAGADYKMRE
jgi:hypothetical protein